MSKSDTQSNGPSHDVFWAVETHVQVRIAELVCRETKRNARIYAADMADFDRCPFCGQSIGSVVLR